MSLKWVLDIELARGGQAFKDASRMMRELRSEAEKTQQVFSRMGGMGSFGGGNTSIKIIQNLRNEIHQTSQAMNQMKSSGSSLSSALSSGFNIALTAIKTFGAAASAGLGKLNEFTDQMVEHFSSRSATIRSYKLLLGNAREAEEEYGKAGAIAQKSDFTKEQVIKQQSSLIKMGLRGKQLDRGLYSLLDIGTSNPMEQRESVMNSMQLLYRNVLTMGRMNMRDFKIAARVIGGGEGGTESPLLKILSKAMGVSEEDLMGNPAKKGKSRGLLSKGLVGADIAIPAIQQAVLEHLNTKSLGEYTVAGAGDLKTLISNREEAFQNLAQSFDSNVLPGVQKYKKSLDDSAKSIFSQTKESERLGLVYQDLANTSANIRGIWEDFTKSFLDSFSSSYMEGLKELGVNIDENQNRFDNVAESAKEFGAALGKVGTFAAHVVHAFENMGPVIDRIRVYIDHTKNSFLAFINLFKSVGEGLQGMYEIGRGNFKAGYEHIKGAVSGEYNSVKTMAKETYAGMSALITGAGVQERTSTGELSASSKIAREIAEKNKKELEKAIPKRSEKIKSTVTGGGSGGGGAGGSGGGINVGSFSFGFSGGSSAMMDRPLYSPLPGTVMPALSMDGKVSYPGAQSIVVQNVNIDISETGLSSEEVANAVYDKFVSQVNRLSRNPTSVRS